MYISVDRMTGWAWIPLLCRRPRRMWSVAFVRSAESRTSVPWIAVGNPLGSVEGFRRSHEQAQEAHAVAIASGSNARKVTAASEPGLAAAALMGSDLGAARVWVGEVLGPLASCTRKRRAAARNTPRLSSCGFKLQGCRRGTAPALQLGEVPSATRVRTSWPTDQRRSARRRSRLASVSLVRRAGAYNSSLTRVGPPPENFGQRADMWC